MRCHPINKKIMGPPSVAPGIIVIYPRELFISSKFIFDKDMGKINLILTCLAMFSCQARCQERTSSGQQGKVDKEEQTEIEICSKYAVENGYKKIGYRQFNERCKYFFNMDLDTIPNLYNMINTVNWVCNICKDGQYLIPADVSDSYRQLRTGQKDQEQLMTDVFMSECGPEFLAYNKLLFNDDKSSEDYFINGFTDESSIVVFSLDYEKSDGIIDRALDSYDRDVNRNDCDCPPIKITEFLFYHNRNRGYRKKVLTKVYQKYSQSEESLERFADLAEQYENIFLTFQYPQKAKDSCAVSMIKCFMDYDKHHAKHTDISCTLKAYTCLYDFIYSDNDFLYRLMKADYFQSELLKILVNNYMLVDKIYFVDDADNYTNVRDGKGINAKINQRVKSGDFVTVIKDNGDWWYVRTNNGKFGYIHKSKLKSIYDKAQPQYADALSSYQ